MGGFRLHVRADEALSLKFTTSTIQRLGYASLMVLGRLVEDCDTFFAGNSFYEDI